MSDDEAERPTASPVIDLSTLEEPAEVIEVDLSEEQRKRALFIETVWERCQNRCGNCGYDEPAKLKLHLIVPEQAGGKQAVENATLLCRACEMAAEAFDRNPKVSKATPGRRLVNFYLSRSLYERIEQGLSKRNGFNSKGSLCRYLMGKYVEAPDKFTDLDMWQDQGADKVKMSIWVASSEYKRFQSLAAKNGNTVTSTIISLVMLFEEEAEYRLEER
jgi:hypothetical protein